MKPFFSVLIPAYHPNFELFDKCIKSILNQSIQNFEIIVCDQGEEDLSIFLNKYRNRNIKIIHLESPSSYKSRISLYKCAIGKYVLYADCDDIYFDGAFEWLFKQIKETSEKDLYIYSFERIPLDFSKTSSIKKEGPFEEISQRKSRHLLLSRKMKNMVFLKCVKRNENISFPDNDVFMGDDILLTYAFITSSSKIAISKTKLYGYRENFNSGSSKMSTKLMLDEIKVFNTLSSIEPSKRLLKINWLIVFEVVLDDMINLYTNKKITRQDKNALTNSSDYRKFKKFYLENKQIYPTEKIQLSRLFKFYILFEFPFVVSITIFNINVFLRRCFCKKR